jgi:hypothetical protein
MTANTSSAKSMPLALSRVLYAGFLIMSCYYVYRGDLASAGSNLGIGLIFDPFNGLAWEQRKVWQKGWLIVHLTFTLGLLAVGLLQIW